MKSAICQMPRHVRAHSANTNETDVHVVVLLSCFPVMSSEAEISLATWRMEFEPIEVRDSSTSVGMTENTGSHSGNIKHQPYPSNFIHPQIRPAKNGL
jgi:hypothetical protein